jgi:hypothetical protein
VLKSTQMTRNGHALPSCEATRSTTARRLDGDLCFLTNSSVAPGWMPAIGLIRSDSDEPDTRIPLFSFTLGALPSGIQ